MTAPPPAPPSAPLPTGATPPKSAQPTLGKQTGRGVLWLMSQTLIAKFASLAASFFLARLLLESDYGLVGMAFTFVAFANLLRTGGVNQVLVQKAKGMRRWANAAAWFSGATGLLAGGLIAVMSPVAASFYGEPQLVAMMLVLAAEAPLAAFSVTPTAALQVQMRFRTIALVGGMAAVAQHAGAVGLAFAGFGPLSFVLARPFVALAHTITLWTLANVRLKGTPDLRRWPALFGSSAFVMIGMVFFTITQQGDRVALGRIHGDEATGIYYFAFALGMQIVTLLNTNLQSVLLPALSSMGGQLERQATATVRAATIMATIAFPACAAMSALADPVVVMVFGDRWLAATSVFMVLAPAMALRMINPTAMVLVQARARFGQYAALLGVSAVVFAALVVPAATRAETPAAPRVVAWCVLAHAVVMSVVYYGAALRGTPDGARLWLTFVRDLVVVAFAATAPFALGWWLARLIEDDGSIVADARTIAITAGVGAAGYTGLLRVLAPRLPRALADRVLEVAPTRLRSVLRPWSDRILGRAATADESAPRDGEVRRADR
ncbi:MAG: oligosaccharide flippase family protein [Planctomycetota bacterium]